MKLLNSQYRIKDDILDKLIEQCILREFPIAIQTASCSQDIIDIIERTLLEWLHVVQFQQILKCSVLDRGNFLKWSVKVIDLGNQYIESKGKIKVASS